MNVAVSAEYEISTGKVQEVIFESIKLTRTSITQSGSGSVMKRRKVLSVTLSSVFSGCFERDSRPDVRLDWIREVKRDYRSTRDDDQKIRASARDGMFVR